VDLVIPLQKVAFSLLAFHKTKTNVNTADLRQNKKSSKPAVHAAHKAKCFPIPFELVNRLLFEIIVGDTS